jgi:hypothetical protein
MPQEQDILAAVLDRRLLDDHYFDVVYLQTHRLNQGLVLALEPLDP